MKKITAVSSMILSLSIAGCVNASPRWDNHNRHNKAFEDTARVLKVKPIYETISVNVPEEYCWDEKVRHHHRRHNDSHTGPILGAVVGGVIGNQFGHKSGKTAMTVAGTLLGASIGSDINRDHGYLRHGRPYRTERHCETRDHYESREEITGYRVKYRYEGRVYHTRMDHHPGESIRVTVNIRPSNY